MLTVSSMSVLRAFAYEIAAPMIVKPALCRTRHWSRSTTDGYDF